MPDTTTQPPPLPLHLSLPSDRDTAHLPVPCRVVIDHRRLRPLPPARLERRNAAHPPRRPLFHWYQATPIGRELYVALYTPACAWARCTFCTLPSRSADRAIEPADLVLQVQVALDALLPEERAAVRRFFLSNNGSTLDPATLPRDALRAIVERVHEQLPALEVLCFETRFETIDTEVCVWLHDLFVQSHRAVGLRRRVSSPSRLQLSAGYETQDPFLRNRILRKGYGERAVQACYGRIAAASELVGARIELDENVMLKPAAGLTDEEAIDEAVETIAHVTRLGAHFAVPVSVRLNPTFAAAGSLLAGQFIEGGYTPPTLYDCVEVLRRVHAIGLETAVFVGLDDEGLAVAGGVFDNRDGTTWRYRRALRRFNGHQSLARLLAELEPPKRSHHPRHPATTEDRR